MKTEKIKAEIAEAKRQMDECLKDKVMLDLRISQLGAVIETLTAMLQPKPDPADLSDISGLLFGETGISGAIRFLLMRSEVPLTPMQIKQKLTEHGFDLSDYANAMAVIHNTLKRLDKQGELMTVKDASGQTVAYTTRFAAPDFGPRRLRAGDVTGPTSAYDSGMRGDEKPKR